jgi:hypothetical protein
MKYNKLRIMNVEYVFMRGPSSMLLLLLLLLLLTLSYSYMYLVNDTLFGITYLA